MRENDGSKTGHCGSGPLVSIVTPFYNTAEHLEKCIESVLAQTWPHIDYLLVDNCSTDGSAEIAQKFAKADPRVRLSTNKHHLSQLANYNNAMPQISPKSRYCKIVQADDWIYPECVARMVEVGEADAQVGLVSSYRHVGREIAGSGLAGDRNIFDGHEIGRHQLTGGNFVFGSQTTVLYRSCIVSNRVPFYDETSLYADTWVCYDILKEWKFGFVHEVLSFTRVDDSSAYGGQRDLNSGGLDKLLVLIKYGLAFLGEEEHQVRLRQHERKYYRSYVQHALGPRSAEYRQFHMTALDTVGYRLSKRLLTKAAFSRLGDIVLNPKQSARQLLRRLRPERIGR